MGFKGVSMRLAGECAWHTPLAAHTVTLLISESAHVSKSECLRCFKVSMQTTPLKYLTEYRLQKAAELLTTTDEPIGTIAMNVGFKQSSHFGKCFKEKTGYSPRRYRYK